VPRTGVAGLGSSGAGYPQELSAHDAACPMPVDVLRRTRPAAAPTSSEAALPTSAGFGRGCTTRPQERACIPKARAPPTGYERRAPEPDGGRARCVTDLSSSSAHGGGSLSGDLIRDVFLPALGTLF
jgi:hypothetical protein